MDNAQQVRGLSICTLVLCLGRGVSDTNRPSLPGPLAGTLSLCRGDIGRPSPLVKVYGSGSRRFPVCRHITQLNSRIIIFFSVTGLGDKSETVRQMKRSTLTLLPEPEDAPHPQTSNLFPERSVSLLFRVLPFTPRTNGGPEP